MTQQPSVDATTLRQLLHLLDAAVHNKKADASLFNAPSGTDWDTLLRLSRNNNVDALVCDAVQLLPDNLLPPRTLWLPCLARQKQTEMAYKHLLKVQTDLTNILRAHGIKALVLKGTTLAALYPTPSHRLFDDIDLFTHHLQPEADALIARQYGIEIDNGRHRHSKFAIEGVTIENHYALVDNHKTASAAGYEQLLLKQLPSPTFEALFLLRHTAMHFATERITLRHLCDWMLFIEHHTADIDWKQLAHHLDIFGMSSFVGVLDTLLAQHLGFHLPSGLPTCNDGELLDRVLAEIVVSRPHANRIHRLMSNRWKHRLCFCDPWLDTLLRTFVMHFKSNKR